MDDEDTDDTDADLLVFLRILFLLAGQCASSIDDSLLFVLLVSFDSLLDAVWKNSRNMDRRFGALGRVNVSVSDFDDKKRTRLLLLLHLSVVDDDSELVLYGDVDADDDDEDAVAVVISEFVDLIDEVGDVRHLCEPMCTSSLISS